MRPQISRALGTSIALKTKYGAGYRISIVTDAARVAEAKEQIMPQIPNAKLEDESAGAMIFQFPPSSTYAIPAFIKYLDTQSGGLVKNWSISNSSLEEVFLVRHVTFCQDVLLELTQYHVN